MELFKLLTMAISFGPLKHLPNPTNFKTVLNVKPRWFGSFSTPVAGSPILAAGDESMYAYTSGRWIYNEPLRMKERYLKFNIPALKSVMASSIGQSASNVTSFIKLAEGGFNRVFEATLSDGHRVLARLPYPSTVPNHYGTASEVATMEFLRLHNIPVPRVYGWSSTADNAVGAEYIVMEKIDGDSLAEIWPTLDLKQQGQIIKQVVHLEKNLFSIQLPASGSIYFPDDLSSEEKAKAVALPGHGDKAFCMGPMAHYSWWDDQRSSLALLDRGPSIMLKSVTRIKTLETATDKRTSSTQAFHAVGKKELAWTERFAKPRRHYEPLYRQVHGYDKLPYKPHIEALHKYLEMAKWLGYPEENYLNRPVLRHPDLSMSNIRVSKSLEIAGLIDWQHATILPLCLAAGIPRDFQYFGDPDSERMKPPSKELPLEYNTADPEEQELMRDRHARKWSHFFYSGLTWRDHEEHFNAISTKAVALHQMLYRSAGSPWEGDSISLHASMISAIQQWEELALSGSIAAGLRIWQEIMLKFAQSLPEHLRNQVPPLPIFPTYSDDEIRSVSKIHAQQAERDNLMASMRDGLGVDDMGWVPGDEEWVKAKTWAQELKEMMLEASPCDKARDGLRDNFPWDDHDEDGQDIG
ncbi:kinase-like protein [Lophium mytilinum]|uniref:Kinase-like protein n=1 Tax=Lophium mytilinum TaxID=390894 RepID=A0A6A6R7P2_9PEZI|nr:kinase-like protein [Lophium mytilinum]